MQAVRRFVGFIRHAGVVACLAALSSALPSAQTAHGHLVVIGGGTRPASIMTLFACLAGGAEGRVLVFPQASERPEAGAEIEQELKALGIGRVVVLSVDRAGADADETLHLADGATGAYFGGGDQARLMAVLRGTRFEARLRQLYRASTSSGGVVTTG